MSDGGRDLFGLRTLLRSGIAGLAVLACALPHARAEGLQFVEETVARFPSPNPSEYTNQLSIGDIDNDNDLDIIFANGAGFSSQQPAQILRIYVNDGTGVFEDNTENSTGNISGWFRGVEMGDIDDDGDLDLICAQDFSHVPMLMINNGTGRFERQEDTRLPNLALSSSRAQFGDVDNDGDLDIFITSGTTSRFTCGQYRLYINDGAGFYSDATGSQFPIGNVCNNMDCIFGDIDNDFDIDIRTASTGSNQSRLYRNDGTGTFSQISAPSDSTCYSYDFGDIDGDGDLDLFGANGGSSNTDILLLNNGNGSYSNVSGNVSPNPNLDDNDSKFFDFDNDADLDLLVGRLGSGGERLYRNNGNGVFSQTTGIMQVISDSTLDVMVADVNNDGKFDIVTAQGESGNFQNRIYMNNGPEDTLAPRIIATEQFPDTDQPGPYVVRALVLDDMTSDRNFFDKGIFVHYTVNGGTEQQVQMKHSGGQVYRGAIPNQPQSVLIEYYVSATDWNDNTGTGDTLSFSASGGDVPAAPLAEDSLAQACVDDDDCPNVSYCSEIGTCYVPKNRYVSMAANPDNTGIITARRVSIQQGDDSVVLGWVGMADAEDVARIEPAPVYMDWSGNAVVHLGDCAVAPNHTYWIQTIAQGADVGNEGLYSTAVELRTTAVWGDVKGGGGTPPDGNANFDDVLECVLGFQQGSALPDVWLDLDGQVPNLVLNLADVLASVSGFQLTGYPFANPGDCP